MSEQIKYEAVFGPQELFDGMMGDCEFASEEYGYIFANGILYYCERYNEKAGWSLSCKSHLTFKPSAMRRIIRTPVWSKADQEAGRLPEVGAKVCYFGIEYDVLATDKNSVCFLGIDKELYIANKSSCKPIETPEERAKRVRKEWVESVRDITPVNEDVNMFMLSVQQNQTQLIYDALLSGELKMPEVQK